MLSVDTLAAEFLPRWQHVPGCKALLRYLLHEQAFVDFAAEYPHLRGLDFVEQVLEYFHFHVQVHEQELEHIPASGPVVIVANHPIGSLDGLALLRLVCRLRPDTKVVANQLLARLEPLASLLLPVDNLGGRSGRAQLEALQHHLGAGGVVIIFPAGEVSRLSATGVRDGRWHAGFIRMAIRARADIVPIHLEGRNSAFFYLSSLLCRPLSGVLLVREMFRQRNRRISLRIGRPVAWQHCRPGGVSDKGLAMLFRNHLYRLGKGKSGLFETQVAIAPPEPRQVLKKAVEQSELLGRTRDGKAIYLTKRDPSGHCVILREIGRLRELAFRAVGEGTGKRRDLDPFDDDYYQLLLWDPQELEVIGAYRFVPAARQLERRGADGLYTHQLFAFDDAMTPFLEHGIELGRSFIQPAYQGRRSLDYLWFGIGAFLARHPHYRYLFGPVSLSAALPVAARDLLVAFYRLYFSGQGEPARSRRPLPASPGHLLNAFAGDDYRADLQRLKQRLDHLGAAIPTLYKQYAELCEPGGVQFVDFGTDPDFADCVDGLVIVDLARLKPARYQRYIAPHTRQEGH
ncbi:lysophospholipid acyltransferase family protein [Oceanimonas sp. CHS3-5]|uniref:lysophospholipid acyltransferase family protein n=1 Tax=Oceanimonas sp. CHS3-5 TaxID=3068186 RepID=UPI00273F83EC|nr:lysophospholipid acyltransferase family protein [Oceanimonas sp. CHS3-5]MDP5291195.1 lysophospholipid acyltransferase family protein [Oceanimonas sp. CHS3-5]